MKDEITRGMTLMGTRNISNQRQNCISIMKIAENYFKLGTENAFIILAKAKKLESEGKEIINLGIGQPDFLTPKHIVEAAKKALDEWSSWIYSS